MKNLFTTIFATAALLMCSESISYAAGYVKTLSTSLEVNGYSEGTLYDFQTNTPEVLPTTGDLRYRDGGIWGLHNFGSGTRSATISISGSKGDLIILQDYDNYTSTITNGTKDESLTNSTGYNCFIMGSEYESITISCPRYGGVVAALVMPKDNSATTADYTINYIYETEVIKTTSGNVAVGTEIQIEKNFTKDGTKYFIVDGQASSLSVEDGGSSIDINLRLASTFNYTVIAEKETNGTITEGESFSVAFSKYILENTTLKEAAKEQFVAGNYYNVVAAPTEDNQTFTVSYSAATIENVVYFSEAENIEGATISTAANANIRCSNAAGAAFSSDTKITTLEVGKYIIGAAVWGAAGTTYTISAGEENNFEMTTAGYIVASESDTIYITEQTDVVIAAQAETSKALDYVYVRKVGDITTTYTIKYVNELGSPLDCIDNIVTEINVGEEFTATEAQMAEIVDGESELTYVYKSGNETKTAVADATENVITLVYELKVEPQDPGTVTSVGSVKANAAEGDIYTLGGVKVVNPTPGLYIQNGKLVRVK
ncbi:MAG: hypothetical protein K6G73_04835 [Marinilabiliaceae bacterium]|nr:hypothetical protein [Marinilabiliaceae bacterium]